MLCLTGAAAVTVAVLGGTTTAGARTPTPSAAGTAIPSIVILSPRNDASYQRGSRIAAQFRCSEGESTVSIVSCRGTVPSGHALNTRSVGTNRFTVTATDASGNSVTTTVRYGVWAYVNPLRDVRGLQATRIDMGVDYSGSGPILAIGNAKVVTASWRAVGEGRARPRRGDGSSTGCWTDPSWENTSTPSRTSRSG